MNIGILYGVAGGHHHAVSKVDAHMTFSRSIIRSLEENKVTGLCFGFADVLALVSSRCCITRDFPSQKRKNIMFSARPGTMKPINIM